MNARMARLTWTGDNTATDYIVEAKALGSNTWKRLAKFHTGMGHGKDTTRAIFLDTFFNHPPGPYNRPAGGLADHSAYLLRVKAVNSHGESRPSRQVMIIDTPIVSANGHSPGTGESTGQAKLTWIPIETFLENTSLRGGSYAFRYRRAAADHTQLGWRPSAFESDDTRRQSELHNENTITGLSRKAIYAIQLIYTTTGGTRVYAARDFYVWPSDQPANGGQRVAIFPLNYPINDPDYSDENPRTYAYRICEDGFTDSNNPNRLRDWKILIQHALGRWQLATNWLVEMDYVGSDCANYTNSIEKIGKKVREEIANQGPLTTGQIRAFLNTLDVYTTMRTDDVERNEIIMIDKSAVPYSDQILFPELSSDLGLARCVFKANPTACANPMHLTSDGDPITDILLPKSILDYKDHTGTLKEHSLSVPGGPDPEDFDSADGDVGAGESYTVNRGDTPFNYCREEIAKGPYPIVVHEAGHVLGIRRGTAGAEWIEQMHGHPSVSGSVMSYKDQNLRPGGDRFELDSESNCSPHPFDIMAIYALYQSL